MLSKKNRHLYAREQLNILNILPAHNIITGKEDKDSRKGVGLETGY